MEMHAATVWEAIADTVPDRDALVQGATRRTWREFDERSARLASAFLDAGLGHDSKIGMLLYNGNEYLETQYAALKIRAVPINVNYRYLDDELWYLLDNADAEALVFHSSLGDRVERIRERLPKLRLLVSVDDGPPEGHEPAADTELLDGAVRYEELIDGHPPAERIRRGEDDLYMLYTGGTTGMPKGVMYAMGGLTESFIGAIYPVLGIKPTGVADEVPDRVRQLVERDTVPVSIPTCPLMHGTGMWIGAMMPQLAGGTIVNLTSRHLDGHEVMALVEQERASMVVIVGDAMCKPLVRAIDEAVERGRPYDTTSLGAMTSSGVMWTAEVKQSVLERIPQIMLIDAIGSTEGSMGTQITMRDMPVQTARFAQNPTTKVFTADGREVRPGSGETGMVAAGGNVPLGYFKDEAKSAATFRVIDGVRYSFPGDWASIEADGTLSLLGRGSQCINTGGEKVYPEEVEEAVKRTRGVYDCLVVGLPDEKFGEAVTAVVSPLDGAVLEESEIVASVKAQLAGYKAPRRVVIVETVPRAPNGKADYRTAKTLAAASVR